MVSIWMAFIVLRAIAYLYIVFLMSFYFPDQLILCGIPCSKLKLRQLCACGFIYKYCDSYFFGLTSLWTFSVYA